MIASIQLSEYLPFFIPLLLVDIALAIYSVLHIWKHRSYRFGNTIMWIIVVLAIQLFGPVLYFTIGKGE